MAKAKAKKESKLEPAKVLHELPKTRQPGVRDTIPVSGQHVRWQRQRLALSQKELGERLGISEGAVASIEAGRTNRVMPSTFRSLADLIGMSIEDARLHLSPLRGKGSPWDENVDGLGLFPMRRVPYFNFALSASGWSEGFVGRTFDDADGFIEVPSERTPRDAFAIRIKGDCMMPLFHDGAIVVCVPVRPGDNGQQFEAGKAYYVQVAGERATFKLCFYEPAKERYRLESTNEKYKPLYVAEQDMQRMSRAIKIVIDLM